MGVDPLSVPERIRAQGRIELDAQSTGPEWTLSAAGDISLVAAVRERMDSGHDGMFDGIADALRADVVYGNLETAVLMPRPNAPDPEQGIWSRAAHIERIIDLGFDTFCLANNHTTDLGDRGLADGLALLDQRGVRHVGAGMNLAEARRALVVEQHGVRVGVLAYAQPEANGATDTGAGVAPLRSRLILEDVAALRARTDVVILTLHEGFEFTPLPRMPMKTNCHRFIDAGADVIIGHHPHVPHGVELYHGGVICYSLGNFIFDFPYHREHEWTRKAYVARFTFRGTAVAAVELVPVHLTLEQQLTVPEGEARQYVLDYIATLSRDLLDDAKIHAFYRGFAPDILRIVLGAIFSLGKNNDDAGFEEFVSKRMTCDPYIKVCRDYAAYAIGDDEGWETF